MLQDWPHLCSNSKMVNRVHGWWLSLQCAFWIYLMMFASFFGCEIPHSEKDLRIILFSFHICSASREAPTFWKMDGWARRELVVDCRSNEALSTTLISVLSFFRTMGVLLANSINNKVCMGLEGCNSSGETTKRHDWGVQALIEGRSTSFFCVVVRWTTAFNQSWSLLSESELREQQRNHWWLGATMMKDEGATTLLLLQIGYYKQPMEYHSIN